jgi:RNA polymerase sigma-70 factor (ECF subfamily)
MERNPKGYLLSVALGLWKNRRRKYAWRQRIAGMDSLEEKAENGDLISDTCVRTPEEDFLMNEKKKAVQECIAQLPEAYRIPMVLYYSAELSLKETAEILKLSEGTVKSRLYKARKIIKGKLEANGYDR